MNRLANGEIIIGMTTTLSLSFMVTFQRILFARIRVRRPLKCDWAIFLAHWFFLDKFALCTSLSREVIFKMHRRSSFYLFPRSFAQKSKSCEPFPYKTFYPCRPFQACKTINIGHKTVRDENDARMKRTRDKCQQCHNQAHTHSSKGCCLSLAAWKRAFFHFAPDRSFFSSFLAVASSFA